MSRASSFCPVTRDLNDYLDSLERPEPETERARCGCGRFFSREAEPPAPYKVKTRCSRCEQVMGRSDL